MNGHLKSKYYFLMIFFMTLLSPLPAKAGHLFTQASANTPINLTSGTGIQITQLTYEGVGTAGNVSLNFNGDWGSGDAIKITIGSYVQTFTYASPLSGTTQTASALVVADPTLAAAGITKSAGMQWTVIATSGDFTFTGYRIYVADGTFNGTGADTITQSQVVSSSSLGGGTFTPVADTNSKGIAGVLDAVNGSATGQLADVITTLSAMSTANQQQALKLMSPETSQAINQSAMNTAVAGMDTVQIRLDSVRTGTHLSHAGSRTGLHSTSANPETTTHAPAGSDHDESSDSEGMSAGDSALKHNLWLKAFGGNANRDAKDGYAGSDDHVYGTMLGYDTTVKGGWLVGVAFGYAKTNVNMTDYREGDGADVETFQLTGYFGRSYGKWYVDGMVTYAAQEYTTARNTHLTGTAVGDFSGGLYGLRVLVGAPVSIRDNVTVTPYVGVEANRIEQRGYTESGAGALSLNVQKNSADRVRSLVGAELATRKELAGGGVLRPSTKLSWRHEFKDEGVNTTTSMVGGGGEFETAGQSINRNVYGLTARLNWERTESMNLAIEVGAETGSGYSSLSGQVMGGWRF